jgi:hypothetical protein
MESIENFTGKGVTIGSRHWAISDTKLSSADFVLTPIPEPSTLTLLLFGALAGLAGLRCRR